jgi:hypothetical protein
MRRRRLRNILPKRSSIISEALSVTGSGHDLEGVVAKRLKDGYGPSVRCLKIKNPSFSQNESAGARR